MISEKNSSKISESNQSSQSSKKMNANTKPAPQKSQLKQQTSTIKNTKKPNGKMKYVSPATKLLEQRRMMYEVTEQFEKQKDTFKEKEKQFSSQEEMIKQKDWEIQDQLINYCKFLQENDAKRVRAEKRFKEEEKSKQQKINDITTLNQTLSELNQQSEKLDKKVQALKKYEDYLELVIKSNNDQYSDLLEIVNRHKVLTTSNEQLIRSSKIIESELNDLKHEQAQYEKEKNNEIIQLNNDIKDLQKKMEEKDMERGQLQSNVESSTNDAIKKNLDLGCALMEIDNLYTAVIDEYQKFKNKPLQQQFEETKDAKEKKKAEKDQKGRKQLDKQDLEDEENFENRCNAALEKIKVIGYNMQDYKKIIDKFCNKTDKTDKTGQRKS